MSITFNGPVVPLDVNNEILRDALFHSPIERLPNRTSAHLIEIGVREGAYTTWVGTWDQSQQKVKGATPTSILDEGRKGMRLRAGQAIVVKVTSIGTPASLVGSRITFTLSLVGGRDGPAKPLIAAGTLVADASTRTSLKALEKQINTGGLAEWDDAVALQDTTGGGIQTSSATTQTITAGAATSDGLATVTVTVPANETVDVLVVASASFLGNGGVSSLNLYIGDGTTDHGVMPASSTATVKGTPSTNYAARITATTTFKVRFDCITNNALIQNQTISAIAMR